MLALLGACSFEAAFEGIGYRCDPDHDCPDGTVCLAGTCQPASNSGGDAGDRDGDGGGGDPDAGLAGTIIERACPGTILDEDDFAFQSQTRWYSFVDGDGDMGVTGGVERARLFESNARAGLVSAGSYPLPKTAFAIRVPAPAPQAETYAAFEIISQDEETAFLTIYRRDDRIVAEETEVGMAGHIVDESLYDLDKDHVWRIRREESAVTWETSPDAVNWTQLATAPPMADLPDVVRLRIVIETGDLSASYQQDFDDMVVCALE